MAEFQPPYSSEAVNAAQDFTRTRVRTNSPSNPVMPHDNQTVANLNTPVIFKTAPDNGSYYDNNDLSAKQCFASDTLKANLVAGVPQQMLNLAQSYRDHIPHTQVDSEKRYLEAKAQAVTIAAELFLPLGNLFVAQHENLNIRDKAFETTGKAYGDIFLSIKSTSPAIHKQLIDTIESLMDSCPLYTSTLIYVSQLIAHQNRNSFDYFEKRLHQQAIVDYDAGLPAVIVLGSNELRDKARNFDNWKELELIVVDQDGLYSQISQAIITSIPSSAKKIKAVRPNFPKKPPRMLVGNLLAYAGWDLVARTQGQALSHKLGCYICPNVMKEVDQGVKIAHCLGDSTATTESIRLAMVIVLAAHEISHPIYDRVPWYLVETLPDAISVLSGSDFIQSHKYLNVTNTQLIAALISDFGPTLVRGPRKSQNDQAYYISATHSINAIAATVAQPNFNLALLPHQISDLHKQIAHITPRSIRSMALTSHARSLMNRLGYEIINMQL